MAFVTAERCQLAGSLWCSPGRVSSDSNFKSSQELDQIQIPMKQSRPSSP